MTLITFQDGKPVLRGGKVGTGQACCGSCGCGRCVVDGQWNTDYRTQAECERCRLCVESLSTECDGDCPPGTVAKPPLVTLEFSSTKCGTGGTGSVKIGCGTILSATVTDGGSGYATETITEPTLSLSVGGTGTGAVLSINGYTKLGDYWVISGITVVNGGTGYGNNTPVTVVLGANDEQAPGQVSSINATVPLTFRPPQDVWVLQSGSPAPTGSGLVVSLALTQHPSPGFTPANQYFWVNSWSVVAGGTGYAVGQRIRPLATEGRTSGSDVLRANLEITSVNASGGVTGLDLVGTTTSTRNTSRGLYVGIRSGPITSVSISSFAGFRKRAVSACPVTVTVAQQAPSAGTGATITATVETAAGANFGKVKSLTVTNGGSGYAALCERKTTVATCDECPSRESPESSTCEEAGGCPCGTWVVDDNQGPCGCCKWEVRDEYYAVDLFDSELSEQRCDEIETKLSNLAAAFQSAGWTAAVGGSRPGQGDCGRSFYAVCEGCEKAYPKSFTPSGYSGSVLGGEPWDRGPCDLDQWVSVPLADVDLAIYAGLPLPSPWCNPQSGGPFPGAPGSQFASVLGNYVVGGMIYIPKCGQRITECSCCRLIASNPLGWTVVDEVDRSCCAECPEGYTCYPGACNPLP